MTTDPGPGRRDPAGCAGALAAIAIEVVVVLLIIIALRLYR